MESASGSGSIRIYDAQAARLTAEYEALDPTAYHATYSSMLPPGRGRLALDVGAGSGRDADWLTGLEGDTDKRLRLMGALDDINGRFGRFTAVPGSQGHGREWRMRADMKSPAWTTRIGEVPAVRA